VSRAFLTIVLVAVFTACGTVLVMQVRDQGVRGVIDEVRQGVLPSPKEILQRAANAVEEDRPRTGSYRRTDLGRFRGVMLVYATDSSYCLQLVRDQRLYHLAGPRGEAADGGC
jgi:hypothetical protein